MEKQYYTYILTNAADRVLYVGFTSDLKGRVYQHKTKAVPGFTSRYNVEKLVYYETFDDVWAAIEREKQLKAGSRDDKVQLVRGMNPAWADLYETL